MGGMQCVFAQDSTICTELAWGASAACAVVLATALNTVDLYHDIQL